MENTVAIADEQIADNIYYIRGQKVMLDADLALLYGIPTKRLKEQVKRNIDRFPERFVFELTKEEYDSLRSHFATLKNGAYTEGLEATEIIATKRGGHSKYMPYAFTEHGILMLANVLKSGRAIEMSIKIIDVFVKMRELLFMQKDMLLQLERLEQQVLLNSNDIGLLFETVKKMLKPPPEPPRNPVEYKPTI